MKIHRAIAVAVAAFLLAGLGGVRRGLAETDAADGRAKLLARFVELEKSSTPGKRYMKKSNDGGELAWGASAWMDAWLDVYEATRDGAILRRVAELARTILANTDAARGVRDYKGRLRNGWSATKYYVNGARMTDVVETGLIVFPLLRLSVYLRESPQHADLRPLTDEIIRAARAALADHEPEWRYDEKIGEGWFVWEQDSPVRETIRVKLLPIPVPINYLAAIGKSHLFLHKLEGKEADLRRLEAIARYVKRTFKQKGDHYVWNYARELPRAEDINHGGIDVDFAIHAYRAGVVFDLEDMRLLAGTFRNMRRGAGLPYYVDGGIRFRRPFFDGAARWLDLSEFDCEAYRFVRPHLEEGPPAKRALRGLLGVGKLIRYYDRCGAEASSSGS